MKVYGRANRDDQGGGIFIKCDGCRGTVLRKAVEERMQTCPECGFHFRITWQDRVRWHFDPDSFIETNAGLESADPLGFVADKSYRRKLWEDQRATGLRDAVATGSARIEGRTVAAAIMDFRFIGGSMGGVVGEKIARCVETAAGLGCPFISFAASGGARMQEGAFSLMQMVKTAAAVRRFQDGGGLYISVMTDPTTGGVLASFASLGDVIIAEPGALIRFAGARVIREAIKHDLPEGFQKSEDLLERGFLDAVVPRTALKKTIATAMSHLKGPAA
ncbi:MAG TPA: acetyl-CoA carboxylase, carboxyltransferase subunit beta [Candidatus Brocadiia bacterium]|nr:acetyl-CoA carboxylase, carboxyltransferase subunit beta [Candidatus Brocadiia bacterium]